MIMFHAAAGGEYYTAGLLSREQPDLDLSGLADLDRAILVGWSEVGATRLWRGPEPVRRIGTGLSTEQSSRSVARRGGDGATGAVTYSLANP